MRIVDSHAHVAMNWYEPLESLDDQMRRNGVARAVLTQPLGNTDNAYIMACRRSHPERYAAIVLIDPAAEGAIPTLERLARDGAGGVRLRPGARSPGGDGLDIWRAAGAFGLAVSSPGASADFASVAFAELIGAVPDVTIVLEHLAGASTPATSEQAAARADAFSLARFPNVYLKAPGIGEISRRVGDRSAPYPFEFPSEPDPFLDAFARFGPARLMWGSDFPVVSSREGYANALRLCIERFASCTPDDRELIFGGVADRVFASRP